MQLIIKCPLLGNVLPSSGVFGILCIGQQMSERLKITDGVGYDGANGETAR